MGKISKQSVKSVIKPDRNITPCGKHLKALRVNKGLSQERLGFELSEVLRCGDIDKSRISKWERGGGMRESVLDGYIAVFDCKKDYLLGKSTAPNRTERQERQQQRRQDSKAMQDYMRRHRASLVEYAAELCECSVDFVSLSNAKWQYYNVQAEVCTDNLGIESLHGFQWLNYYCKPEEFDLLTQQVDRAIENVFKSFIELKSYKGNIIEPKEYKP